MRSTSTNSFHHGLSSAAAVVSHVFGSLVRSFTNLTCEFGQDGVQALANEQPSSRGSLP